MQRHTKYTLGAILMGTLGFGLCLTLIGAIIGVPMVIVGFVWLAKAHELKHGDRPWWSKSFLTLRRERKERKRAARGAGGDDGR